MIHRVAHTPQPPTAPYRPSEDKEVLDVITRCSILEIKNGKLKKEINARKKAIEAREKSNAAFANTASPEQTVSDVVRGGVSDPPPPRRVSDPASPEQMVRRRASSATRRVSPPAPASPPPRQRVPVRWKYDLSGSRSSPPIERASSEPSEPGPASPSTMERISKVLREILKVAFSNPSVPT
eukprot:GHVO01064723.1.p1 GENE.GHVO01064723.1~~GHVO01064723.1.p1  ORF type:complete len:182 (-),score=27.22 GHVO01064723.1:240-785(-)